MFLLVELEDCVRGKKRQVVRRVTRETDNVQKAKVKVQPGNRFAPEIQHYLRIEGDRPRQKIHPANHLSIFYVYEVRSHNDSVIPELKLRYKRDVTLYLARIV